MLLTQLAWAIPFHWTNWCQTSCGLSYQLINRESMVWVGVISPSVSLLFQYRAYHSRQPSANFLVLTVIVVQICHAACTEAGYSSTRHQRICVIDKHLVNIHHIISKAYADYSSDLWSVLMCTNIFQTGIKINGIRIILYWTVHWQTNATSVYHYYTHLIYPHLK